MPSTVESDIGLQAAPGGRATTQITVRNTGSVVDEYSISVLGPAREFVSVSPTSVSLFPGASAPVMVTVAPPRTSQLPAGDLDIGIMCASREDPDASSVEELVLTLLPFRDVDAELVPRTLRGSRRGKGQIAIDNRGNEKATVTLDAQDADGRLGFGLTSQTVMVPPGTTEFVVLRVQPHRTFLRGQEQTVPFRVDVSDGTDSMRLDGSYVQTPIIPKWLARLLAMMLLGLVALALLWQFAFKPVIRSAAISAATDQVDEAAKSAAAQTAQAVAAVPSAAPAVAPVVAPESSGGDGGGEAAGEGSGGGKKAGGAGGAAGAAPVQPAETPVAKRVTVDAAQGETAQSEWAPGEDKDVFSLTDVVLQNPQGDSGRIRILRGDEVLLESALENFRDLDFHFIAPYTVTGQPLKVEVLCANTPDRPACAAAATLGGFLVKAG
jgi:hypothetical protein